MDERFWIEKWQNNDIGFHETAVNPALVRHFGTLHLETGGRVFVPLCGKTLDIAWLLSSGYRVAGVELSELAVEQLFVQLGMRPRVSACGALKRYGGDAIDIFVGDFFDLSASALGQVDRIYDRAALVALPEETRPKYTKHLMATTDRAPQLLVCYEYDQRLMSGPPFAIGSEEVSQHYTQHYDVRLVARTPVAGGLKGTCPAQECVWLLQSDRGE